jgi:hypothetical protein
VSEVAVTLSAMSELMLIDCDGCPVRDPDGGADGGSCGECVIGLLLSVPRLPRGLPIPAKLEEDAHRFDIRRQNCQ